MQQLELNSTIVLSKGLTGEIYFQSQVATKTSKKHVEEAAIDVISKYELIPRRCVRLMWSTGGALQYNVSVILRKIKGFVYASDTECFICGDPCEDADSLSECTREANCKDCSPDTLCTGCSVPWAYNINRCLACIDDLDIRFAPENYRRRRNFIEVDD